jgi:UDP-3-O-[3-hydroxymyristoyl] N-acetylglucosamine deacetylase
VGVGVHSGRRVSLTFHPAEAGTGIVFRRSDIGLDFPARFDRVIDTRLCTVLGVPGQPLARLGTVEHMMAAFAGCGIDNAIVEIDGPELPIVDGAGAPGVLRIECAGTGGQDAARREIEILRTVRVTDGEAFAELRPGGLGFRMAMSIEFRAAAIGRQALTLQLTPDNFRREIAEARTFTDAADIEHLRKAGLAQGGSLANAVVVDAARVLNPGGLRRPDEFVRHKLLDAVGDLALAGAPLRGRFAAHRSGHTLNNRLLRALFAVASAWRIAGDTAPALSAAA